MIDWDEYYLRSPKPFRGIPEEVLLGLRGEVGPSARILDVGCGSGGLLDSLGRLGFKHLSGIDFAQSAVDIAQRKTPSSLITKANLESDDFQCAEVIFCHLVMPFIADRILFCKKLCSKAPILFISANLVSAHYEGIVPDTGRYMREGEIARLFENFDGRLVEVFSETISHDRRFVLFRFDSCSVYHWSKPRRDIGMRQSGRLK